MFKCPAHICYHNKIKFSVNEVYFSSAATTYAAFVSRHKLARLNRAGAVESRFALNEFITIR